MTTITTPPSDGTVESTVAEIAEVLSIVGNHRSGTQVSTVDGKVVLTNAAARRLLVLARQAGVAR